jgi:subtilisin family serine protease
MLRHPLPYAALAALSALALAGSMSAAPQREPGPRVPANVRAQARSGRPARVIVGVRGRFVPEGSLSVGGRAVQRADIRERLQGVISRLPPATAARARAFTTIPFFAADVDAVTLLQLEQDPDVASIEVDVAVPPVLADSTAIVGATTAWSAGYTGTGWTVAILDTGVDKSHSFMGGRVLSEACYSNAGGFGGGTSLCPGGASSSTASGSGVNCTGYDGCYHGTHVAGIAAGAGSFNGVAPAAGVISIQVFSGFAASDPICGGSACALTFTSDQIAALERVLALRHTFNIAAVNMSLGGGRFTHQSECDRSNGSRKAIIDSLRSAGIATVIASGNDGWADALSEPGCISSAVSVAATTKADAVSGFSNSASFLSLLAPGEFIRSSVPGGFASLSGTSMAAPHVAGAWALLKQRTPSASVSELLTTLRNTGLMVTDPLSGLAFPRIRADRAINSGIVHPSDDFDGDRMADVAVYRPSTGMWYVVRSRLGTGWEVQWGWPGDTPVPADYDGDRQRDMAVYRPSSGVWHIVGSGIGPVTRQWGLQDDTPVPADYDGDGRADIAVYRPSNGGWYIIRSSGGIGGLQWGLQGDLPVPADYDADGKVDLAVYRPSNGVWYLALSTGTIRTPQWGWPTDTPVPADYDGDGLIDIAVYRPSTGVWYVIRSGSETGWERQWGWPGDTPMPADYDGDGRADLAVYRPSTGTWYQLRSTTASMFVFAWGVAGDIPLKGGSR